MKDQKGYEVRPSDSQDVLWVCVLAVVLLVLSGVIV